MSALLEARRVHLRHSGTDRDAVRDVTLRVAAGERLALVGPNGSGKSTLLAALGRALEPRTGSVLLEDRDVRALARRDFARRVVRLPQSPTAAEGMTVEVLVACGRHAHRGAFAATSAADRAAVRDALRSLDLLELRHRALETLSGGERRRAWLAMAICQGADVMLLDEPTAALDLRHQWEVLRTLARLAGDRGTALVLVLHDLEQAAAFADRVAVLHRGRIYETGPPEACVREEMLRDVFGVDARVVKEDGALRLRIVGPADPLRSL